MKKTDLEFVFVRAERSALLLPEVVRANDDGLVYGARRKVFLQHLQDGLHGAPRARTAASAAHVHHHSEAERADLLAGTQIKGYIIWLVQYMHSNSEMGEENKINLM